MDIEKINHQEKKIRKIVILSLIAFFAVVVAVNALFILLSKKSWRGIEVENSYEKGLNYNEVLKKAHEQESLAWSINLDIKKESAPKNSSIIRVHITDRSNNLVSDAKVRIKIRRPTQEGFDQEYDLIEKEGYYETKVSFPLKGQWQIDTYASKNKDQIKKTQRVTINTIL